MEKDKIKQLTNITFKHNTGMYD